MDVQQCPGRQHRRHLHRLLRRGHDARMHLVLGQRVVRRRLDLGHRQGLPRERVERGRAQSRLLLSASPDHGERGRERSVGPPEFSEPLGAGILRSWRRPIRTGVAPPNPPTSWRGDGRTSWFGSSAKRRTTTCRCSPAASHSSQCCRWCPP